MLDKLKHLTKTKSFHICMIIVIIVVILFIVGVLVLRYNVEGETNMPFELSKIAIISSQEGIDDGQTIRMRGEGNAPIREGINGDLNIRISVTPHKILTRKGNDIYLDLYIPFTKALLGTKIEIPTLKGSYLLTIPELTSSGTVMRLKNKGVKILNRESYGDMLVTIKAEPPKSFDKSTRKAIEELDAKIELKNYAKYQNFLSKM